MTRRALVGVLLILITGCITDPDISVLDRPDLSRSNVEPIGVQPTAPTVSSERPLTVDEAVQIALINNPDIGQAIARLKQAGAMLARARAPFLPSVDANGGVTHYFESQFAFNMPGGFTDTGGGRFGIQRGNQTYDAGLTGTWNLFAGGRDVQNYKSTKARRDARRFQSDRVEQEIENAVRAAYYEVLLARENIEIAKASETFSARELKDARARHDVGRGLKTDVLTFETKLLNAQVEVTVAENSYRLARIALGELMALRLRDDIKLVMPDATKTNWEKMGEEQVIQAAWDRRPDLRAVRNEYAAAKRDIKAAQADYFPQVNASASYSNFHRNSPDFHKDDDDVTVGLNMVWNLYRGGDTVAAVAAARHAASETAEAFRNRKLEIESDVSNAFTNIENARRRVELGEKEVDTATEALRLITDRYRAGAVTISEVTEGELRRTEAREDLIRAKIDLLRAQSELKLAVGSAERPTSSEPSEPQGEDRASGADGRRDEVDHEETQ